MRVTIHFEGKLKSEDAFAALVRRVQEIARKKIWLTEVFKNEEVTLLRVRDEEESNYAGAYEAHNPLLAQRLRPCASGI